MRRGPLLACASSFGQTFLIALSGGEFRAAFGLSRGAWARICRAGPAGVGRAEAVAGTLKGRLRTRTLTASVLALLVGACLPAAFARSAAALRRAGGSILAGTLKPDLQEWRCMVLRCRSWSCGRCVGSCRRWNGRGKMK